MVITRGAVHQRADIEVEQHIVVDGVKLIRAASGRYYAESRSAPGTLWFLTGFSCQCPGFVHRQTCRHHRALMVALGWISDTPEPTPPTPGFLTESAKNSPSCSACNGSGTVPATISTGPGKWAYGNETCCVCHGTGRIETAA